MTLLVGTFDRLNRPQNCVEWDIKHSLCNISPKSVNRLMSYGQKTIFKVAGVPTSWILKLFIFGHLAVTEFQICWGWFFVEIYGNFNDLQYGNFLYFQFRFRPHHRTRHVWLPNFIQIGPFSARYDVISIFKLAAARCGASLLPVSGWVTSLSWEGLCLSANQIS